MSNAMAAQAPWYRHRWPWILIAGPAVVVVAGFCTLWLAVRSDDGLVADDYYKQGLAINRTIARAERAAALGIVANVSVAPDGGVTVALDGPRGFAPPPVIRLSLLRPAHGGSDRVARLLRGPDGRYVGKVAAPEPGRWQLIVEADDWRLPSVEANVPLASVTVRAAEAAGE